MSIQIQARGFTPNRALKNAVHTSLLGIFDRHQQVRLVDVILEDSSGRHGVIDKSCQIILELAHAPSLVIRSTQGDMTLAIKRCAAKIKNILNGDTDS